MKKQKNNKIVEKYNQIQEKYSYGNDIEFHLFDKEKQKMVSAIPVLKHDKNDPIDLGDGINFYHDNILCEVSFPPYYSKEEMFNRFETVLKRIKKHLGDKYDIVPQAAYVYDKEELKDKRAMEAGCSVNFNAYTVKANPPTHFNGGLRSAGFHCHVGNEKLTNFKTRLDTIKMMDIFVGCSSLIFNSDKTEIDRRKLYGRSSEHRPTNFGLEYRPLSPGILRSKETTELVYDLINFTLSKIEDGSYKKILKSVNSKMVIKAIDSCNQKLALQVLKLAKLPEDLMERVTRNYETDFNKSWGLE